tara:strand:+ start:1509 stop:1670 length:162 start_codon:yes stop_codon:yes gene_type:complete
MKTPDFLVNDLMNFFGKNGKTILSFCHSTFSPSYSIKSSLYIFSSFVSIAFFP